MSFPISVVPFHGDSVITLDSDGKQYVAITSIVDALGVSRARQREKITQEERWTHKCLPCQTPGGTQEMLCIPLRKLNGWLFSINPNKVRPDLKERVIQYQEECFEVLHDYWQGKTVSRQNASQTVFDKIDNDKLAKLQRQNKELAWEYLESLGIERPQEQGVTALNSGYNHVSLNELAAALKPVAKEYDNKHFFVHVCEMNAATGYQRRPTLNYLLQQKLLFPGEYENKSHRSKLARKVNRHIAEHYFNGARKRVYVISWKLFDALEAGQ